MRFFVPGEEDAEAAAAWERMRESCGAQEGTTRPIYSITSDHDGTEITATVGEENVIAIIAALPSRIFVFEDAESAGEWADPRSVPLDAVVETWFFDDD
jgi:hypothetical protein